MCRVHEDEGEEWSGITRADAPSRGRVLASAEFEIDAGNHQVMPCTIGLSRASGVEWHVCIPCLGSRPAMR